MTLLISLERKSEIWNGLRRALRPIVALLPLLVLSCTTTPKTFREVQSGEWEARALVKNKSNSKKYIVNIDFIAERPQFLRVEVSSAIGSHLASFAMNKKNLSWVIPNKKKWFRGMVNAENLRPVFGHPIDPRLIYHILFDEPIPEKSWSCTADINGNVTDCRGADDMKIVWSEREGKHRNVLIQHPHYEIQLQFHNFEKPESIDPKIFEIEKPNA